jgi:hypothetical protein
VYGFPNRALTSAANSRFLIGFPDYKPTCEEFTMSEALSFEDAVGLRIRNEVLRNRVDEALKKHKEPELAKAYLLEQIANDEALLEAIIRASVEECLKREQRNRSR